VNAPIIGKRQIVSSLDLVYSAVRRNGAVVIVVRDVTTETTARKNINEQTFVQHVASSSSYARPAVSSGHFSAGPTQEGLQIVL
jgi:hypothetical protein